MGARSYIKETIGAFRHLLTGFPAGPGGRKEINITLADMSSIWMKYNEPFRAGADAQVTGTEQTGGAPRQSAPASPAGDGTNGATATGSGGGRGDVGSDETVKEQQTAGELPSDRVKSSDFYVEFIAPYRDTFIRQGLLEDTCRIIELLEKYGNDPSIVNDVESHEFAVMKELLMRVSIKSHTFRVTKMAVVFNREKFGDAEELTVKAIIAALGHDLGKIRMFVDSRLYGKGGHETASAAKIKEIFGEEKCKLSWMKDIIKAIESHHQKRENNFDWVIKMADWKARQAELVDAGKGFVAKEWEEWFDVAALLKTIEPFINVTQTGTRGGEAGSRWVAQSFENTVYCSVDILRDKAKEMMIAKKVLEMRLYKLEEKENAVRAIVESLRKHNVVDKGLEGAKFGVSYELNYGMRKVPLFAVPIKIEAFGNADGIRRTEQSQAETLLDVRVVKK